MRKKKQSSAQIPAASPEALQKARVALGEKPATRMEEIEADKKFIAERPKQRTPTEQLKKSVWEQASEMLRQEEEKKRRDTFFGSAVDDDGASEMIYCLEECDYLPGDELGDEEDLDETPQPTASDNGTTSAKKKAVDLYPDAKVHFQTYQFDPGLKRGGTTTARSLPDHIWTALQAVVGPMPVSASINTPVSSATFAQSVAGKSDKDMNTGKEKLGFHLDRSYRTLNAASREVTPENAWVFSEERLQDFVVRLMDDDKIAIYEKDPDNPTGVAQLFKRAIKAWFNLYFFYRVHTSDLSFSEMEGLQVPKGLWALGADNTDVAARKMHRKRLLVDGIALYGSPPDWKPLDPDSIARSKKFWDLFERIRHQVIKPSASATCRKVPAKKKARNAKK